ncbi:MAG: hypothetical protein RXP86_08495 [Acidilobus sp.]
MAAASLGPPDFTDESLWRKFFEQDLANFYLSLCRFKSMVDYVRGLAGKPLSGLTSDRDLLDAVLFGGIRDECIEALVKDPEASLDFNSCFPCDSVKRLFYHGLGVGFNNKPEVEVTHVKPALYGYYGENALSAWDTTMVNDLNLMHSLTTSIYKALSNAVRAPECVNARPGSAEDIIKALEDLVNNALQLLPEYNPISWLALALYSSSPHTLKILYGVDVRDSRFSELAKKYGFAYSIRSLSPNVDIVTMASDPSHKGDKWENLRPPKVSCYYKPNSESIGYLDHDYVYELNMFSALDLSQNIGTNVRDLVYVIWDFLYGVQGPYLSCVEGKGPVKFDPSGFVDFVTRYAKGFIGGSFDKIKSELIKISQQLCGGEVYKRGYSDKMLGSCMKTSNFWPSDSLAFSVAAIDSKEGYFVPSDYAALTVSSYDYDPDNLHIRFSAREADVRIPIGELLDFARPLQRLMSLGLVFIRVVTRYWTAPLIFVNARLLSAVYREVKAGGGK